MLYTVDNLLQKLALVGNSKIWKEIPEGVTVKGIASNIKPYDRKTYFDLLGSGKKIRACCASEDTPSEGAAIEFNGLVTLQTNNHGTNLQIMINGSPIGSWERQKKSTILTSKDLVKYNNKPLSSLIGEFQTKRLLLIGTETAINDVIATLNTEGIEVVSSIVKVSQKSEVLSLLKKLKEDPYTSNIVGAIAVVRGGDDDSMDVWDDSEVVKSLLDVGCPFFTALGHSHRVTLADKYAAQSFPTPGNFASSFNEESRAFESSLSLNNNINLLEKEVKESSLSIRLLEDRKLASEADIKLLKSKNRGLKLLSFGLMFGLILLLTFGFYIMFF